MIKQDQALLQTIPINIANLYDKYAGMLLGYIFEVVKDKKLAEDYLIKTFATIAKQLTEINRSEHNTWYQLQQFAKHELTDFTDTIKDCEPAANIAGHGSSNKYLALMTDEQKHIFCNFYYHRKTTTALSKELNIAEELIKKSLKDAFVIIRRTHDS